VLSEMVIPTITFANSSSVSDYVDPSFQDYLRGVTGVPLKRPEFLKLLYLNCRNLAFKLGTGTRSSGTGQMIAGNPEVGRLLPTNALVLPEPISSDR